MNRTRLLAVLPAVALAASTSVALAAESQTFPTKPLRFVVPFAPGGGADLLARLTGIKVAESFGQQVVIDNRSGAGGNIAAEVASKSAADGYTLLQANVAHAISTTLYRKLNYDLLKDFAAVTQLAATPFILAVHPNSPANSVRELIALAKSQPGQLSYGSSGNGGPSHLGTELFKSMAGIDVRHIPYKGGAPAATDLISGQIQMMFNTPPVILPHVRSGRMQGACRGECEPHSGRARTSYRGGGRRTRLRALDVVWRHGARRHTAGCNKEASRRVCRALKAPDVRERLANENLEIVGSTPAEFAAYVRAEIPKWAKVVKASGARVD